MGVPALSQGSGRDDGPDVDAARAAAAPVPSGEAARVSVPASFYAPTASGQVACRLCHGVAHAHAADCPVLALRLQVRAVTAELGLFVASVRELVEQVDTLLRGGAEEGP